MELNELREQIDRIDRDLVSLFLQRMNVAADIAEYKRANNKNVFDPSREPHDDHYRSQYGG